MVRSGEGHSFWYVSVYGIFDWAEDKGHCSGIARDALDL